jgi:fatty acid desaturase
MGLGAIAQQSGLWDLGEAMKPIEEMATGAAKAGAAVVQATGQGVSLPPWLLVIALIVLALRFVLHSPTVDKVVQGRNDRAAHREQMELRKLDHELDLQKMHEQNKTERRP